MGSKQSDRVKRLEEKDTTRDGALPDPPRPWEEMTDEEQSQFVSQFF